MNELLLGQSTPQIPFACIGGSPDATPTVTAKAGTVTLGSATVTANGTDAYFASYTLPGSGINDYTPIYFEIDYDVDGEAQPTQTLLVGRVVPNRTHDRLSDILKNTQNFFKTRSRFLLGND